MTDSLLSFKSVNHAFAEKQVLTNINLELQPGMVVGLLGRNGAGKTTLLRTAVGLLSQTEGEVCLFGEANTALSIDNKQRLGYVPQQAMGYEGFSVGHALAFHRQFYESWDTSLEQQWLERFDLNPKTKVTHLSVGQRQALALIMAMSYRPELLILDEPVASLDPIARREFMRDVFDLTMDAGTAVLFSTHITSDIERVASHVAMMKDGTICLFSDIDDIKDQTRQVHLNDGNTDLSSYHVAHQTADYAIITDYDHQPIEHASKVSSLSLEALFIALNE